MSTQARSPAHPEARRSHGRSAARLFAALLLASVASAASARPYNPSSLPPAQLSEVGDICKSIIGLGSNEEHYSNCVESLSGSLGELGHGEALVQARNTCLGKGLKADTPELAECVLDGSEAKAYPPPAARPIAELTIPGSSKSYFYTSNADIHRREQLACARLGFDPTSGAFNSCVASLAAALFAADNPAH